MLTIFDQVQDAKKLFNEYSGEKDLYSKAPTLENEKRLKEALTPFLQKVLDVCRSLEAKTETASERDLLRQFAGEIVLIFK